MLLGGTGDPILLGLVAGVGGAVGKVTSYLLGRLGYFAVGGKSKENLDAVQGLIRRYGMLGVFIFAVTPLPDDLYIVPMGILRLPFWRFFVADLAGKVLLSTLVAYAGRTYFATLALYFGEEPFLVLFLVLVSTAVATIVVIRSDWALAVEIAQTRGVRGLLSNMRRILHLH